MLPQLLNELDTTGSDLVLVLDDYHLVTNATCHATLGFFVDHLPANVHLVVATRVDPPLALARLRAGGELVELRIAELGFTSDEAGRLLQEAMGLALTADQTQRLWERTEGWAAGLYLAGLSLRDQPDPGPFIASFEAGHRHVVDYLGSEVLARQPAPLRDFMVRTSILQRLSGSLCDAVLETDGSAGLLAELEQANQFLIALDDHRHWYRYHQLFAGSCCAWSWPGASRSWSRCCTAGPRPGTRTTATWRRPSTTPAPAATTSGPPTWSPATGCRSRGGDGSRPSSAGWTGCPTRSSPRRRRWWWPRCGPPATAASPGRSWTAGWPRPAPATPTRPSPTGPPRCRSRSPSPAPTSPTTTPARSWRPPAGPPSSPARDRPRRAGWPRRRSGGPSTWPGGRPRPGRCWRRSPSTTSPPSGSRSPWSPSSGWPPCSPATGETTPPRRRWPGGRWRSPRPGGPASTRCTGSPPSPWPGPWPARAGWPRPRSCWSGCCRCWTSTASSSSTPRRCWPWPRSARPAATATAPAAWPTRHGALIGRFTDPGMLAARLGQAGGGRPAGGRRPAGAPAGELTERELVVLRLLATTLSQREIAQELYVSVNTVRTHIQGVYRKLGAASRRRGRRRRPRPRPPARRRRAVQERSSWSWRARLTASRRPTTPSLR